ncbi:MAG: hypothetical protein AAF219_08980 [Myxococcota bacterium]
MTTIDRSSVTPSSQQDELEAQRQREEEVRSAEAARAEASWLEQHDGFETPSLGDNEDFSLAVFPEEGAAAEFHEARATEELHVLEIAEQTLGRSDVSADEMDAWLVAYRTDGRMDTQGLREALSASDEGVAFREQRAAVADVIEITTGHVPGPADTDLVDGLARQIMDGGLGLDELQRQFADAVITVDGLYRTKLGREVDRSTGLAGDTAGVAYWAGRLVEGSVRTSELTAAFADSREGRMPEARREVENVIQALTGHEPSDSGPGLSEAMDGLAESLVDGELGADSLRASLIEGLDTVDGFYQTILGREVDPASGRAGDSAGLAYWAAHSALGDVTASDIESAFESSTAGDEPFVSESFGGAMKSSDVRVDTTPVGPADEFTETPARSQFIATMMAVNGSGQYISDTVRPVTEEGLDQIRAQAAEFATDSGGSPRLLTRAEVDYLAAMTVSNEGDDGVPVRARADARLFDAALEGFRDAGMDDETLAVASSQLATHIVGAKTGRIHPLVPDFLEPHVFSSSGWETGSTRQVDARPLGEPPFDVSDLPEWAAPATIDGINETRQLSGSDARVSLESTAGNRVGSILEAGLTIDSLSSSDLPLRFSMQITSRGLSNGLYTTDTREPVGSGLRSVDVRPIGVDGEVEVVIHGATAHESDRVLVGSLHDGRLSVDLGLVAPASQSVATAGPVRDASQASVTVATFTGLGAAVGIHNFG